MCDKIFKNKEFLYIMEDIKILYSKNKNYDYFLINHFNHNVLNYPLILF
jgi:hypothetical protein